MDIYRNTLQYAKMNGELEQYRESMKLNEECGKFIRHSIAENFRSNRLDVQRITEEVTEKYGFERVMLMLALRIDSLNWDGRVDTANKEWAGKIIAGYPNAEAVRKAADRALEPTHPVLLDDVVKTVRTAFRENEMSKPREVEGYRIIQTVKTPNAEFVLGQNKNMPEYYVTWYNNDRNGGLSTVWGHYFTSNDPKKNLLSAYRDLFTRALSDVNEHAAFEELTPQIGSIIRTVNGEAVRFELTDEERNGIWDMVEQQNVEEHFRELLCENGYDTSSSGMDKIIAEMAAKYRDDFGYGNDDEFLGYISERDDDIKELHYFGIFGDAFVDKNDVSDYTGRIMIIRPEYFSPRNCTPEDQLFLAQSGSGCNPKEYGGMINGVFLYDREEAAIPSDIFLGVMKEEHIPLWAKEAREDIVEEANEEQQEM